MYIYILFASPTHLQYLLVFFCWRSSRLGGMFQQVPMCRNRKTRFLSTPGEPYCVRRRTQIFYGEVIIGAQLRRITKGLNFLFGSVQVHQKTLTAEQQEPITFGHFDNKVAQKCRKKNVRYRYIQGSTYVWSQPFSSPIVSPNPFHEG